MIVMRGEAKEDMASAKENDPESWERRGPLILPGTGINTPLAIEYRLPP
jgi:hypothetical protein